MPYRRYGRRNYRRRTFARRPKQSKFNYYANTAVKALRLATYVSGLVNSELKFKDNSAGTNVSVAVGAAGTTPILAPTAIAQGDGQSNRDGSKIRLKQLHLRGICKWNNASSSPQELRVICIRTKVMDGTYPTLGDILESPTDVHSFLKIDESRAWDIISDKRYMLNDDKDSVMVNVNKKMSSVVKYIGTAAAEGSMGYGNILVYALSDSATNVPTITLDARVRYYDN